MQGGNEILIAESGRFRGFRRFHPFGAFDQSDETSGRLGWQRMIEQKERLLGYNGLGSFGVVHIGVGEIEVLQSHRQVLAVDGRVEGTSGQGGLVAR